MRLPSVEILKRRAQRLTHKLVTRFKVFVKSSHRHASLFHDIGHTNAIEAKFAKSLRRDFQNLGVRVTFCFPRHIAQCTAKSPDSYPRPANFLRRIAARRSTRILPYLSPSPLYRKCVLWLRANGNKKKSNISCNRRSMDVI